MPFALPSAISIVVSNMELVGFDLCMSVNVCVGNASVPNAMCSLLRAVVIGSGGTIVLQSKAVAAVPPFIDCTHTCGARA